jgi:hypothetical protein
MKMTNRTSSKVTKRETIFKNVRIDFTCEITHITHNWSKFVARFTSKGAFIAIPFNTVEACHKFFASQIEKLGFGTDKEWMPRTTGSARWPNGDLRKNGES